MNHARQRHSLCYCPGVTGIYLALIAAAILVFADTLKKLLAAKYDQYSVIWVTIASGLIINFTAAQLLGMNEISELGWIRVLPLSIACMVFGEITFIRSLSRGDFSAIAPLRAAGPIVSLLFGYFLFNELPGAIALIGVIAVIGGVWWVSQSEQGFRFVPGAIDMIAAQALGVGLGVSIRIVSTDISPLLYFSLVLCGELVVMTLLLAYKKTNPLAPFSKGSFLQAAGLSLLWGIGIAALHISPTFTQVSYAQASSQIYLPISLLISWAILGERDVAKKILPSVMILAGIALIIFGVES